MDKSKGKQMFDIVLVMHCISPPFNPALVFMSLQKWKGGFWVMKNGQDYSSKWVLRSMPTLCAPLHSCVISCFHFDVQCPVSLCVLCL